MWIMDGSLSFCRSSLRCGGPRSVDPTRDVWGARRAGGEQPDYRGSLAVRQSFSGPALCTLNAMPRMFVVLAALALSACGDDEPETETKECEGPCADGNVCTIDYCAADGTCTSEPEAAGKPCGDADVCNGTEACDGEGTCVSTDPIETDDGDPCTVDTCDPETGEVLHPFEATCVLWEPMSEVDAPLARTRHTAVWSGDRLLVWGGNLQDDPFVANTGGVYDLEADLWSPMSTTGAPSGRHSHLAVWTGTRMLVWGGFSTAFENTGGLYDPESDSWSPMSTAGAPSPRVQMAYTWTGERLIVHGGRVDQSPLGDGASYDPATDTWTPLPAGGPFARLAHSVVRADDDTLLFFGGTNLFDWLGDGSSFDGTTWSALNVTGAPTLRQSHAALWTGNEMLVWGGWNGGDYKNDGALFNPDDASWRTMNVAGAPDPRSEALALWTGANFFVWGGCGGDACGKYFGDGALYVPDASGGSWGMLPSSGAPSDRREVAGAFGGKRAMVWGGRAQTGLFLGTGARARLFP